MQMRNTQVPTARQWAADAKRRADYRRSFADTPRQEVLRDGFGDTDDIMHWLMDAVNNRPLEKQVMNFASDFAAYRAADQYRRLYDLWQFCRYEIKYQKDPRGKQFIKHPLVVYEDGHADCKSLMLLQVATIKALRSMGCELTPIVRFASYQDDGQIGHVYTVVLLADGTEVICDSVYHRFDDQQAPTLIIDKLPNWATQKVKPASVNGIGPYGQARSGWQSYLQL